MRRLFPLSCGLFLAAPAAFAQPAGNVVKQAADAFGLRIGPEAIGLYSEDQVRGFSPDTAGNIRLEGLFFRPAGSLTDRAVGSTTIRVGLNSVDQLFPAPSGIADLALRDPGPVTGLQATMGLGTYLSPYLELDADMAASDGVWTLAAGIGAYPDENGARGNDASYLTGALIPRWRPTDTLTVTAFIDRERGRGEEAVPTYLPAGDYLPPRVDRDLFTGQDWGIYGFDSANAGLIVDAGLATGLTGRVGLFHSSYKSGEDAFALLDAVGPDGQGDMLMLLFPAVRSTALSGEAQLSYVWSGARARQTLTAAARGLSTRDRQGGEVEVPLGAWQIRERRDVPQPDISFDGAQSHDRVRQWSGGVAYRLEWDGRLDLGVGLQKAHYRKISRAEDGAEARGRAQPWLYNGIAAWRFQGDVMAYASYAKGLEEAGGPPLTATNRNETLPAVRTTQREVGVKVPLGALDLSGSLFDVRRPYAGLDAADRYGFLGQVRHRGAEASLSGSPLEGMFLVLGAVLLDPSVRGEEVEAGLIGRRPVGQRRLHWQASLDYTPPRWPETSIDIVLDHLGATTALSDNRADAPAITSVDLGLRRDLVLAGTPATLRAQVMNLFDTYGWQVVDDGEYSPFGRRAWRVSLSAAF